MASRGRGAKLKGKTAERHFAQLLTANGFPARRGWADSCDIVCPCLPEVGFEVKHQERLNLKDALDQATRDAAKEGKLPVVAHRANHEKWRLTMAAETFFEILRRSDLVVSPKLMMSMEELIEGEEAV